MRSHSITTPDTPLKLCRSCGEEKPATTEYFSRQTSRPDGLQTKCKVCRYAYNAANRERIAEYGRRYYAKNKEWWVAYRRKNIERIRAYRSEHGTELARKWRSANPEASRISVRRRRAHKRNAEGSHTAEDIQAQYKRQKGHCYYCNIRVDKDYHVDHVIPLARGGSDGPENLVIACPTCNERKNSRLPHEWPEGNRLL